MEGVIFGWQRIESEGEKKWPKGWVGLEQPLFMASKYLTIQKTQRAYTGKGKEVLCGRQKIDDLRKIAEHLALMAVLGLMLSSLSLLY